MQFLVENLIFIIATLALGGLIAAKATILPNQPAGVSAPAVPSTVSNTATPGTASGTAPVPVPAPTPTASSVTRSVKGGEQEGGFFGGFDD